VAGAAGGRRWSVKLAILTRVASVLLGRNRGGGEIPVPYPTKEQREFYDYRVATDHVWAKRKVVLERALRLAERRFGCETATRIHVPADYARFVIDLEREVHERLPLPDPPDFTKEVS
jgi:hypothetical protein